MHQCAAMYSCYQGECLKPFRSPLFVHSGVANADTFECPHGWTVTFARLSKTKTIIFYMFAGGRIAGRILDFPFAQMMS